MTRRALVVCFLCAMVAHARPPASLQDLKALASQKAWAELLERAEDLPPADRTGEWRAWVTEAATAAVEAAEPTRQEPFTASSKARSLSQRYDFLARAPRFAAARDAAARKGLERCLELDRKECLDTYVALTPEVSPDAALEAAHLVRKDHFAYVPMPLFAAAVNGLKDAKACKDEGLAETAIAALGLPTTDPRAADAKKVAFEWCWAALAPKLKAAMVGASSYFLTNACQPMRAKKALTELQDDLCKDDGL
ncbi:hypothetical protein POL68_24185 [Stigmatella sp. ncwal1]|uniref:Uncharacterized protein n=1 Tax=Stigmatella ashevillensis TaxID=2995309 RepID=A0ABT5DDL1_9BACT|nr:hypothetical protein [Stigmatella ashevillena]MDC0711591.1 hypothetical protein [Stigmatella ashevillena]